MKISLYDTYVTGSFVRPTTPDKVRVYVDNEPLPMSTEVIGEFGVIDPVSKRNASLDVLLDTIKKDASYLGANGLFLAEYNKPKWYESYGYHSLYGFVLLQPDTIVKPNREHPLNTSYREALERDFTLRGHVYRKLRQELDSDDEEVRRLAYDALKVAIWAMEGREMEGLI